MKKFLLDRKTCLRGAGVSLALPFLNAMATDKSLSQQKDDVQRLVSLIIPFGVYQEKFHPKQTGFGYTMSETLKPIEDLRNDFTVFSHLEHDVRGGHQACDTFLNGILSTAAAKYPESNMTLDQAIAERVGHLTRFPTLGFGRSYSFTRTGVKVPSLQKPSDAFKAMFFNQSELEKKSVRKSIASSETILDAVLKDAKQLQSRLGQEDRQKLDEYFTSIRGTEKKFNLSKNWLDIPKPKVDNDKYKMIVNGESDSGSANVQIEAMIELTYLALVTDSTRMVINGQGGNFIMDGVTDGYHSCSHHGLKPHFLNQLAIIEPFVVGQVGRLVRMLKDHKLPNGKTMLESTQVLFGSALGSGSRHTNTNLPLVLAGGRYKHGQHINAERKQPLCNLYHTMMEHFLNDEVSHFSVSNGAFKGLDYKKVS